MNSRRVSLTSVKFIFKFYRRTQDILPSMKAGKLFQRQDNTTHMLKERRDKPIPLSLELPTTENGSEDLETDTVSKSGQMVLSMKANGRIIEPMAKESSFILMVTSTMENGSMIKLTVMEFIITSTVPCTKDTGKMIFNMEKEKNHGLMAQSTKANTWLERSTVSELIAGTMEANTKENGTKTKSKALEPTAG